MERYRTKDVSNLKHTYDQYQRVDVELNIQTGGLQTLSFMFGYHVLFELCHNGTTIKIIVPSSVNICFI